MTVHSGGVYDNNDAFKVSNVFDRFGNNSWIPPNDQSKEFILDLGCKEDSYNVVQLVNTNFNQEIRNEKELVERYNRFFLRGKNRMLASRVIKLSKKKGKMKKNK